MSAISNDLGSSTAASSTNAFSAVSSTDFIEIMFAELTNQDPLSPNETKDILQQVGTIRSIESDLALTEKLNDLVRRNEVTSAGTLIGKFVTGRSETGLRVGDFVDSISVTSDGSLLNLTSGFRVPLENLEEIIDPALIQIDDGSGDDPAPVDETPSGDDEGNGDGDDSSNTPDEDGGDSTDG